MDNIDDYIKNTIFVSKTFDAKDVPQLVLLITTLLERSKIDIETTITMLKQMPHLKGKYISSARSWWYLPKPKELFKHMRKMIKNKSL